MEEPLAQFFIWWDGPDGKQQAVDQQESVYRIAQRAFSAGYAARFEAPLEPSRDALDDRPVKMARPYPGHPGYGEPAEPDPFAKVRFTGPQQAAIDSLYPLPESRATQRVWDGGTSAPDTLEMRVVPADLPVRGPVEDVDGEH